MSRILYFDRTKETTSTSGVGDIVFSGAPFGMREFGSVLANGDRFGYVVESGAGGVEEGVATYIASGDKMSRDRVAFSTDGGAKINLGGTSTVFLTALASEVDPLCYRLRSAGIVPGVDCTDEWNDLIEIVFDDGGGKIIGEGGEYLVDGGLLDTGNANAQIVIPHNSLPTGVGAHTGLITIEIEGPIAPPMQSFTYGRPPNSAYMTIRSTLTGGSGTAACIAGTTGNFGLFGDQNNVALHLSKLCMRAPADPTFTMVDLRYHQSSMLRNVLIYANTIEYDGIAEPTNDNAYGYRAPLGGRSADTAWYDSHFFGFYTGCSVGELAGGRGCRSWACQVGMEVPGIYHPCRFSDFGIYGCPLGINPAGAWADGISRLSIALLSLERYHTPHGQAWMAFVADVDDPSDILYGECVYMPVTSETGILDDWTSNAANFDATPYKGV